MILYVRSRDFLGNRFFISFDAFWPPADHLRPQWHPEVKKPQKCYLNLVILGIILGSIWTLGGIQICIDVCLFF